MPTLQSNALFKGKVSTTAEASDLNLKFVVAAADPNLEGVTWLDAATATDFPAAQLNDMLRNDAGASITLSGRVIPAGGIQRATKDSAGSVSADWEQWEAGGAIAGTTYPVSITSFTPGSGTAATDVPYDYGLIGQGGDRVLFITQVPADEQITSAVDGNGQRVEIIGRNLLLLSGATQAYDLTLITATQSTITTAFGLGRISFYAAATSPNSLEVSLDGQTLAVGEFDPALKVLVDGGAIAGIVANVDGTLTLPNLNEVGQNLGGLALMGAGSFDVGTIEASQNKAHTHTQQRSNSNNAWRMTGVAAAGVSGANVNSGLTTINTGSSGATEAYPRRFNGKFVMQVFPTTVPMNVASGATVNVTQQYIPYAVTANGGSGQIGMAHTETPTLVTWALSSADVEVDPATFGATGAAATYPRLMERGQGGYAVAAVLSSGGAINLTYTERPILVEVTANGGAAISSIPRGQISRVPIPLTNATREISQTGFGASNTLSSLLVEPGIAGMAYALIEPDGSGPVDVVYTEIAKAISVDTLQTWAGYWTEQSARKPVLIQSQIKGTAISLNTTTNMLILAEGFTYRIHATLNWVRTNSLARYYVEVNGFQLDPETTGAVMRIDNTETTHWDGSGVMQFNLDVASGDGAAEVQWDRQDGGGATTDAFILVEAIAKDSITTLPELFPRHEILSNGASLNPPRYITQGSDGIVRIPIASAGKGLRLSGSSATNGIDVIYPGLGAEKDALLSIPQSLSLGTVDITWIEVDVVYSDTSLSSLGVVQSDDGTSWLATTNRFPQNQAIALTIGDLTAVDKLEFSMPDDNGNHEVLAPCPVRHQGGGAYSLVLWYDVQYLRVYFDDITTGQIRITSINSTRRVNKVRYLGYATNGFIVPEGRVAATPVDLTVTLDGSAATLNGKTSNVANVHELKPGQLTIVLPTDKLLVGFDAVAGASFDVRDSIQGVFDYEIESGTGNVTVNFLTGDRGNGSSTLVATVDNASGGAIVPVVTGQTMAQLFGFMQDGNYIPGEYQVLWVQYYEGEANDRCESQVLDAEQWVRHNYAEIYVGGHAGEYIILARTSATATQWTTAQGNTPNSDIRVRAIRTNVAIPQGFRIPAPRTISLDPAGDITALGNGDTSIEVLEGSRRYLQVPVPDGSLLSSASIDNGYASARDSAGEVEIIGGDADATLTLSTELIPPTTVVSVRGETILPGDYTTLAGGLQLMPSTAGQATITRPILSNNDNQERLIEYECWYKPNATANPQSRRNARQFLYNNDNLASGARNTWIDITASTGYNLAAGYVQHIVAEDKLTGEQWRVLYTVDAGDASATMDYDYWPETRSTPFS